MSAARSFLQRVVAVVGPATVAGPALRGAAGPLTLGRFLRRRWLPSLRPAMTLARAAEDEDLEEQAPEEPTPSASPSVQTVRRAAMLRRSESPSVADVPPQAASELDSGGTAPVIQPARAGSTAAPVAARNAVRELPASRAAPAMVPSLSASSAPGAASPAHHAEPAGAVPASAGSVYAEASAPAGGHVELRADGAPPRRTIAPLSDTALATVAQRAAEIVSSSPSHAAYPVRGEAAVSFAAPARLDMLPESGAPFAAGGESAAAESALPYGHAAGEAPHAVVEAASSRHASVDTGSGPGSAFPGARDEPRSAEPLVQIGSIEIIIEAPPEPRAQASTPAAATDLASRYYLRGL